MTKILDRMKSLFQVLAGIGLLAGGTFFNASASAEADNIYDYYKQTCRLGSTGEEVIREQFLRMAYTTASHKKRCVIAFLKNGGYFYTSEGILADDYTPVSSRQVRNCITMECL